MRIMQTVEEDSLSIKDIFWLILICIYNHSNFFLNYNLTGHIWGISIDIALSNYY